MHIGVLTGMAAEAACFDRLRTSTTVRVVAADRNQAYRAMEELIASELTGLVSFGVAGGLDPRFVPGDLIVGDRVIGADGQDYRCARRWREEIVGAIKGVLPFQVASIVGSETAISSAHGKRMLYDLSGAAAVDMESDIVAAGAARCDIPLLVLRAIADPADRSIPASALVGIGPDGRSRPVAVLRALLARPAELPSLVRLARDFRLGARALRALADEIEPALVRAL